MPIPDRLHDTDFHYHIYRYAGAVPFVAAAVPGGGAPVFYSMLADLNALVAEAGPRHVPNVTLTSQGAFTPGNRRTKVLSFGNAVGAANPPTVIITGGIHAREWIAHEIAYLVAEYLIKNYTNAPQNRYQRAIRNLVDSRRIHFIPMLNPDGNVYTVKGVPGLNEPPARQWRKSRRVLPTTANGWMLQVSAAPAAPGGNRIPNPPFAGTHIAPNGQAKYRVPDYDPAHNIPPAGPANYDERTLIRSCVGVDLNRNYGTAAWGYECMTTVNPTDWNYDAAGPSYFGPDRNSEIETLNVVQFLAGPPAPMVVAAIDYHSYSKCILYPSEAFNNGAVTPDYQALGVAMQLLIGPLGEVEYGLGSPRQMIHYDAVGTIPDHIAAHYHARAFTIELDPAPGAGDAGFVLPETSIRGVFEKNIRAALVAIAAPRPAATNWRSVTRREAKIGRTWFQFLTWNVTGHGNTLPG
jgi:hypothetical protein